MKKLVMTLLLLSQVASAAPPANGGQGGAPRRPPPQEAIQACEDLEAGDACSFTDPKGQELEGSCFSPDASKPLACKPDKGPEGGSCPPPSGGGQGGSAPRS